jgi:N,N-dimethylformamidase
MSAQARRPKGLGARHMHDSQARAAPVCFRHAPEQYAAIHFHDDDLLDAGWEVDLELDVDAGTPSGVYAVRLQGEAWTEYVPFYVRAPAGGPHAKIALLLPTASYLAYANGHTAINAPLGEPILGHTPVLEPFDLFLDEHREYGLSLYDTHSDGSGVCYSSRLRPILNERPRQGSWQSPSVWQFNADLHLVDWLTERGHAFDVLTDEDLDREGLAAIEPYRVVLTGSHPEYVSKRMLDALHDHLVRGGRLMYLGGNGFYWVIAFDPENRNVIEVRRFAGSQSWETLPGEGYLSTTGERGGTWRSRGRPPQRLVGVGFGSEGFDVSSYYRRPPDSYDPRASWIFDGIADPAPIGDFGLVGGGAAGVELDVYDSRLGTPSHALLLASSELHTDSYLEVREELGYTTRGISGTESPRVRADMVFFETEAGCGVFSTGSIAWCGALSHDDYDNDVSRITDNVLRRFTDAEPLPPPPHGRQHGPGASAGCL